MVVDKLGHDGNGDCPWAFREDLGYFFVLDPNDILSIDLTQVVVDQQTIAVGRGGE